MVTIDDWRELLVAWSEELIADEELREDLPEEVVRSGWLGYAPASDQQLQLAEQRLGISLPHSYRTFLQTTNGWRMTGYFVYRVRPVEEIDWYRTENTESIQETIQAYESVGPIPDAQYLVYGQDQRSPVYRAEYLLSALQISDVGDSAVYLLNPEIQTSTGEWEAWFFATWRPGASRYRSFWEMMQAEYRAYLELRRGKGNTTGV
jgi:hypothetical protein